MSRNRPKSISAFSEEVLAEVESAERVKQAEVQAVRAATPRHSTELGQLMHKAAEELRGSAEPEVTYEDLEAFLGGRL